MTFAASAFSATPPPPPAPRAGGAAATCRARPGSWGVGTPAARCRGAGVGPVRDHGRAFLGPRGRARGAVLAHAGEDRRAHGDASGDGAGEDLVDVRVEWVPGDRHVAQVQPPATPHDTEVAAAA